MQPIPCGAACASEPVVSVRGLHKSYRDTVAVDDVAFTVNRGEIFGLLGPNGAGKTTTVECVQGLRRADAGEISVLGLDPRRNGSELRRRIGSQLQSSALPEHIRVWEALDLFASLTRTGKDWRVLMDEWDLSAKRKASFHGLSGGQRQRLFVALALVNGPELVFLDEMTTGLDPAARRVAWDLIREMRDHGTTVVLVTHFMDEAERLCDRLAVVEAGRTVAVDTPQGLISAHAGGVRIVFTCAQTELDFLDRVPDVRRVTRHGTRVEVDGQGAALALTAAALVEHSIVPVDLHVEEATLEDAYLDLTGHTFKE